ncbi:methyl-accepting chemotaxis protein [Paenibacillus protaetiae]|uniref:Methyl-accepting chemotaxis protein n=1 Tax=Paenibacillus protaetiae TaxID=2509456 RepID=A0A4P6FCA5_9BACL|nr:HAMP domain-containing methyl-accepting chemotaxis protein [Paenibacillus protaetiae]QAY68188.1 methyl-accepting chemotaxis protein [Paenibacillus protaetiae]
MREWFEGLSVRKKLTIMNYASLLVIAIIFNVILIASGGSFLTGIIATVVLAAAAQPIIIFLDKTIRGSFAEMSDAAYRISKGDFTQKIDMLSAGSLGELGHSFNSMIDKLRDILKETTTITRHVSETSRTIFESNTDIKNAMEQVAVSSTELAKGSNEISESISDMSNSITEIETLVTGYANSTREMNNRSQATLSLVERGREALDTQADGMRKNIEATTKVSETIQELSQKAQGISAITKTISDIADQTNLLSLNASIEAARAGEHGKGFAVVAQEVRKLAEESMTSTKQVFSLVKGITDGIKHTIEMMKINEEVVSLQAERIRETEQVFIDIVDSIQFITKQIAVFADESDTMLDGARNISSSIQNISAITQQSAAGTEQVSASMNEQIVSVQAVVQETEKMLAMASQLQRTIQVFKI